ncbi:MAG TPA: hypothetical protein VF019_02995, partial [Nitrospira sp.]
MKGERPFFTFLSSNPGAMFLVAIGVFLGSAVVVTRQYVASGRLLSHHFRRAAVISLAIVALLFLIIEMTLRANSISLQENDVLWGTKLRPLNWSKVAQHHQELIQHPSGDLSYLVHDDFLGWTVGTNREKANT